MNYNPLLKSIYEQLKDYKNQGAVASYIPELSNVNPDQFAIAIQTIDGDLSTFGDSSTRFSIQSISKVISLVLALHKVGNLVWDRVRVEASGNAFDSMEQLEYENGIPRNPLINSGAIVICDILVSKSTNPKAELLDLFRKLSGNDRIDFNQQVAHSEQMTGFRNNALAYFLKSMKNLDNPVDQVLDLYFYLCSIEMNCEDLAKCFHFFANHATNIDLGQIITKSQIKRINAIMLSCGFYDESGDFLFNVGLPGKSGVGGGIVAIHPGHYSVAAWSPRLNKRGNSVMAKKALEFLTTELDSSLF